MPLPQKFIKFDYRFQAIFGGITIALCFVLYGLLLLLPFGLWQVVSALLLVFGYGDKKRIPYLVTVLIWGVLLMLIQDFHYFEGIGAFIYVIILPVAIGIWYFSMTRKDYLYGNYDVPPPADSDPDILDTEI